ncbi:MAG: hypothetical protein GY950_27460 [bacterium]|nr:hypothetical protein [bacterium]
MTKITKNKMTEKIIYITEKEYEKEVLRGGLVALDFYSTECDLLVLGGGPAGLTAGIYAGQAKVELRLPKPPSRPLPRPKNWMKKHLPSKWKLHSLIF